ncbi:MAG: hypothetical protein ACYCW6_20940 [Candidatus Xenobia bacterium]
MLHLLQQPVQEWMPATRPVPRVECNGSHVSPTQTDIDKILKQKLVAGTAHDPNRAVSQLLADNAFTASEQIDALSAIAAESDARTRLLLIAAGRTKCDWRDWLAYHLIVVGIQDETVVATLLKHAPSLPGLPVVLRNCSLPIFQVYLVKSIESENVNEGYVVQALHSREQLQRSCRSLLEQVARQISPAGGVAAVLLGDPRVIDGLLRAGREDVAIAILSAARISHTQLHIEQLVQMARVHKSLSDAIQKYLLDYDSTQSRQALVQLNSRDVAIVGSAPNRTTEVFREVERMLLEEHKLFPHTEIFALMKSELLATQGRELTILQVVRLSSEGGVYSEETGRSVRQSTLTKSEVTRFRSLLRQAKVDSLPLWHGAACDHPTEREYLHVSAVQARRVLDSEEGPDGFEAMLHAFQELSQATTTH